MKIGMICIGNSCRSQMAEGFLKHREDPNVEVYSAGTEPGDQINPNAILVMEELGIDLTGQYPKYVEDIPDLDILVTMGCGVQCPSKPAKYRVAWEIDDPVGKDLDVFRQTRDIIQENINNLLYDMESGKFHE